MWEAYVNLFVAFAIYKYYILQKEKPWLLLRLEAWPHSQTTLGHLKPCLILDKCLLGHFGHQILFWICCRVSTPFSSTRDFVLWLWTAHNEVNERLKKEEASLGTGDPKFPKNIWPSKRLCPTCYAAQDQNEESSSINWDRDEVFKFLGNYYGKTLVSLYKEKDKDLLSHTQIKTNAVSDDLLQSTNALVVPVGAALAIAVASCLFGALACFWRSQQKNRKYFHKPQLLKIV